MTAKKLQRVVGLISEVYFHHAAGGALHIALDDENIDDASIQFCAKNAEEAYQKARAEVHCCNALALLSEEDRKAVIQEYRKKHSLFQEV